MLISRDSHWPLQFDLDRPSRLDLSHENDPKAEVRQVHATPAQGQVPDLGEREVGGREGGGERDPEIKECLLFI